jgi:beta-lactamase regulating signal transducer with metallopeptidase domain
MTAIMVEAALRGLALALIVGLGLSALRVRNVPARKAAWTLVLLASLAMPLLMRWPAAAGLQMRFAWTLPMRMSRPAAVPSAQVERVAAPIAWAEPAVQTVTRRTSAPAQRFAVPDPVPAAAIPATPGTGATRATPAAPRRAFHWPPVARIIVWAYLSIAGALLVRLLLGLAAALRIWATAELVSPLDVPEEGVRASSRIASPVTIGSGIVLPADYSHWDRKKLRMVLAHEQSHVRQMDFYLQLLAGLYTAFFWFSPLGWWLRRTLSELGEAIGDRAGMDAAASRSGYAQVVVEFAAAPRRALPGVAMACSNNLSRRVESMLNEKLFHRAFAEGRRRALASLLLIPAGLFAVTALVRVPGAAAQTGAAAPSSGVSSAAPAQAPGSTAAPRTGQAFAGQDPDASQVAGPPPPQAPALPAAPQGQGTTVLPSGEAQTPPPPQVAPAPPAQAPLGQDSGLSPEMWVDVPPIDMHNLSGVTSLALKSNGAFKSLLDAQSLGGLGDNLYLFPNGEMHGYAYDFSANGDSWALVDGPGTHITLGDGATKEQLDLAQRMARGPYLWFTHDGKSYIVDDPAIVAQIRSLYAPMKDLSRQEEELGIQERVLSRMDAELARSQRDSTTVRLPDLSKEMADAQAAIDTLKTDQGQTLSEEKLTETEAKLAEVEARLDALEARAVTENNFAERMRDLGAQQRQLGDQQRQLGEQQKKLAQQADEQVKNLIQQSLKNGKATQVK